MRHRLRVNLYGPGQQPGPLTPGSRAAPASSQQPGRAEIENVDVLMTNVCNIFARRKFLPRWPRTGSRSLSLRVDFSRL
eukprot:scaffold13384_cov122-Isochrysis_galbana.AAC.1